MKRQFGSAYAEFDGTRLTVGTGRVSRTWRLTKGGLRTAEITCGNASWTATAEGLCDWTVPGVDEAGHLGCELLDLRMEESDDEGFSSRHLAVTLDLRYPGPVMDVRFCVWTYPEAPGLRTQLFLRPGVSGRVRFLEETGRAESLPFELGDANCLAAGYYNGTQGRNTRETELLREEQFHVPHTVDWAGIAMAEKAGSAIALIKESHKCVNQSGCDTGAFVFDPADGVSSTGWGLAVSTTARSSQWGLAGAVLDPREYHPAWAHWTICVEGGEPELQRAIKDFDRLRYPVDPERDLYIIANTWGSRGLTDGRGSRDAAAEANVLREIDAAAELGIDIVQIDDGWQLDAEWKGSWHPPHDHGWRPHPTIYPDGWTRVRRHARRKGVELGLWAGAQWISREEMIENWNAGGFRQWKLDFANLREYADLRELVRKMREFTLATGHRVRMNLDVTEDWPRFGYFFGREFGCCYLENRKPKLPKSVVYVPYLVLRDLWQVAKYCNLNRFQGPIQNLADVDPALSDAHEYEQTYAVALVLASTPLFFMEVQRFDEASRSSIKPLLDAYRRRRDRIYRSSVYPIGEKPDNASWTGFQCHLACENAGYLLLFRERLNDERTRKIVLQEIGEATFTNCLTGAPVDGGKFEIPTAPGFLFLEYQA